MQAKPQSKTDFLLNLLDDLGGRLAFKRPRKGGERWYLVSMAWWKAFAGEDQRFNCENLPVLDNSPLLDDRGVLREGLCQGQQFEAIPEQVYGQLKSLFPAQLATEAIPRYSSRDSHLEVYLTECKVRFHDQPVWVCLVSKDTTLQELSEKIANHFQLDRAPQQLELLVQTDNRKLDLDPSANTSLESLRFSQKNNWITVSSVQSREPAYKMIRMDTPLPQPPPFSFLSTRNELVATCGLSNIGNSCYLNAVLQCLFHCEPLRALLLAKKSFESRVNPTNMLGREGESVFALHEIFSALWSRQSCTSPLRFKLALDKWTSLFRGFQQHDAHELMQYLLDLVHEDTATNTASSSSICNEVFGGVLNRDMVCPMCGEKALATPEPFHILSLSLMQPEVLFVPLPNNPKNSYRYIKVASKTTQGIELELQAKLKTPKLVVRDRVAFEIDPAQLAAIPGSMYVFGYHEVGEKRVGMPFHFYLARPHLVTEHEIRFELQRRYGSSIGFLLQRSKMDELTVQWDTMNPKVLPQMPLPSTSSRSSRLDLRELLDRFCAEETMEGDNLWFCPTCKEKRAEVRTKYSFAVLPKVLVLHLKRFSNTLTKITQAVRYPLQLHVGEFKYSLFAILRHHGDSIGSGHYDVQILHPVHGKWFTCNDSHVSPIQFTFRGQSVPSAPSSLDSAAYMYLYRKQD